mmetsp:Transcript_21003/g.46044  ORF Transcript_21003/g.46044 Transcript_21003/m.46044 type:complete len:86 (-) Transcript_21003:132-389(-)
MHSSSRVPPNKPSSSFSLCYWVAPHIQPVVVGKDLVAQDNQDQDIQEGGQGSHSLEEVVHHNQEEGKRQEVGIHQGILGEDNLTF